MIRLSRGDLESILESLGWDREPYEDEDPDDAPLEGEYFDNRGDQYTLHTDYSGRFMYGRECIGVSGPGDGGFQMHAAMRLADKASGNLDEKGRLQDMNSVDRDALIDQFDRMGIPRVDSMGRGIICYWTNVFLDETE